MAGNSTFRIVFCNLGIPETVISNFVSMRQIETPYSYPYLFPYGYPNGYSLGGTKNLVHEKSLLQKCINSFLARK